MSEFHILCALWALFNRLSSPLRQLKTSLRCNMDLTGEIGKKTTSWSSTSSILFCLCNLSTSSRERQIITLEFSSLLFFFPPFYQCKISADPDKLINKNKYDYDWLLVKSIFIILFFYPIILKFDTFIKKCEFHSN